MKVLFVGKEWRFRSELKNELFRYITYDKLEYINSFDISFIPKEDTLIVTTNQSYPLVTRIISTILNQNPVIKDNQLVPENAKYSKNSYLVKINEYEVNVILLENKVPEIFILMPKNELTNIFNMDKDTAKMLIEPIFSPRKIDYTLIQNEGGFLELHTEPLDKKIKKEILRAIPFVVFGNVFKHIIKNLPPEKITFAESCTGGLIASTLTKYSGSSDVFDGSVVTYANRIKNEWLGVSQDTLKRYGAVSEQTVKEMLLGAIEISKANYAIAVSGIAGPTGGTPEKPVGTVYIGVANKKELKVEHHIFKGDRNYVQYQAMMNGIRMFINFSKLYSKDVD